MTWITHNTEKYTRLTTNQFVSQSIQQTNFVTIKIQGYEMRGHKLLNYIESNIWAYSSS